MGSRPCRRPPVSVAIDFLELVACMVGALAVLAAPWAFAAVVVRYLLGS